MKKLMMLAVALAAAANAPAARAESEVDEATRSKLTEQLTAEGYEVRKIEMEDGKIEVYALKDGTKYALYFDDGLTLVETKQDAS